MAFREQLTALPAAVRQRVANAYRSFLADPHHPGLRIKPVEGRGQTYSIRVGLFYRAIGRMESDTTLWYWIGSHADYDKLLRR